MKYFVFLTLFAFSTSIKGQMYNESPFNAQVANPKYNKSKGPKVLIDAGHHNFIVELGLAKPLIDVANSDGYQVVIDSMQFTKEYLSNYKLVIILPAMPFTFGSKKQVTDEITFSKDELNALHEWVLNGGRLLIFSEHAPIDKSVTP